MIFLGCAGVVSRPEERPLQGPKRGKIALFPFENHSGKRGAVRKIMPLVRRHLKSMGYSLADEGEVERFLARRRIRRTGEISLDMARRLMKETGAGFILVGSIEVLDEEGDPRIGLTCRLLNAMDGRILWAESVGMTGEDFTTLLGFGRIRSSDALQKRAVRRLFQSLHPVFPEPAYDPKGKKRTIAIVPFENLSGRRAAGRIVVDVLLESLLNRWPYLVIEPGEVRNQLIRLKVRYLEAMGEETMKQLGLNVGADALLLGTVTEYRERTAEELPPRVAIHIRLYDVGEGRLLRAGSVSMGGDDLLLAFDFGKMRSIIPLVEEAAERLIAAMERQKKRR